MSLRSLIGETSFKEANAKAAQVLPAGERLLGSQLVRPGKRLPTPRRGRRPLVFQGLRMPGDKWEGAKQLFWNIVLLQIPIDSPLDALLYYERKRGKPLKGGWNSLAGQFAVALHPRSKTTGVVQVLQLTERRLQVTYIQRGRRNGALGVAEPGWSTDIAQVAWLRDRSDVSAGTHEIGFADSSWARFHFSVQGSISFIACFPHRLRHTDPIP